MTVEQIVSMFLFEVFGVKSNSANSAGNLGVTLEKMSPSAHISAVCSSSMIYGIFAITLIWMVQNYLQMLLCLPILSIAINFCQVLRTPTAQNFNVFRIDWPAL